MLILILQTISRGTRTESDFVEIIAHTNTPNPLATCSFIMRIDKNDEVIYLLKHVLQAVEGYIESEPKEPVMLLQ